MTTSSSAVDIADLRLCFDRVIPDHYQPARASALRALREVSSSTLDASSVIAPERIAVITAKKWESGKRLRCHFLNGDDIQQGKAVEKARLWEQYANITFDFSDDPDAEIRVAFQWDNGSWSAVGTDALVASYFPPHQPTVNFGWLTADTEDEEWERVVVHEFGHVLGCIHEHQQPSADLKWNKPLVYRIYSGPPNGWDKATIDHNIFDHYSSEQTQFTQFDLKSIMLYHFPAELFLNGQGTPNNTKPSETDENFMRTLYPK